jgi:hypothetical protein
VLQATVLIPPILHTVWTRVFPNRKLLISWHLCYALSCSVYVTMNETLTLRFAIGLACAVRAERSLWKVLLRVSEAGKRVGTRTMSQDGMRWQSLPCEMTRKITLRIMVCTFWVGLKPLNGFYHPRQTLKIAIAYYGPMFLAALVGGTLVLHFMLSNLIARGPNCWRHVGVQVGILIVPVSGCIVMSLDVLGLKLQPMVLCIAGACYWVHTLYFGVAQVLYQSLS